MPSRRISSYVSGKNKRILFFLDKENYLERKNEKDLNVLLLENNVWPCIYGNKTFLQLYRHEVRKVLHIYNEQGLVLSSHRTDSLNSCLLSATPPTKKKKIGKQINKNSESRCCIFIENEDHFPEPIKKQSKFSTSARQWSRSHWYVGISSVRARPACGSRAWCSCCTTWNIWLWWKSVVKDHSHRPDYQWTMDLLNMTCCDHITLT